jgi:hypothetical protein
MTRADANALYNPFIRNGAFRHDRTFDCTGRDPDSSALRGHAVALTFPTQAWVEAASYAGSITALFIDRPKATDLSPVSKLPLTNFTVSYPSRIKDWAFLQGMHSLARLSLHNTLSLSHLEPVRGLVALEVLQLSGGYSKWLELPSLAPLASCSRLAVIDLAATRCVDPSLRPLFGLTSLRRFDCPLSWPRAEVEALFEHNKAILSDFGSLV